MSLWSRLRRLDEWAGLLPRTGPFDCLWCSSDEHPACTGVALRPRMPGGGLMTIHRLRAETETCACHLRGHAGR